MATGAAEMMLRCVFDGILSIQDIEIDRRPYHKNCSCAMHKPKKGEGDHSTNACSRKRTISFPKKQSWSDGSLPMEIASKVSSQSSLPHDYYRQSEPEKRPMGLSAVYIVDANLLESNTDYAVE